MKQQTQMDRELQALLEIIHVTGDVSAKVYGLSDEPEIFKTVGEEFAKSKKYNAAILLLTDDNSNLKLVETSLPESLIRVVEGLNGTRIEDISIDLNMSSILRQVAKKGETIQVNTSDLTNELFPQPLAASITEALNLDNESSIITPLKRRGEIIGSFAMTATSLAEYLTPSTQNLARHISSALDLTNEYTERERAEIEVRNARDFSQTLLNIGAALIITIDREGYITLFNKQCEETTGWEKEEVVGKQWVDIFFAEEHKAQASLDFKALFRKRKVFQHEQTILTKDREERIISWNSTSVRDMQGKPTTILSIGVDVTERAAAEREIMQRNRELAALNAITTIVNESITLEEILDNVLENIANILDIEFSGVALMDRGEESLSLQFYRGISDELAEGLRAIKLGDGIVGSVAQSGEPAFVRSLPQSLQLIEKGARKAVVDQHLKSLMLIPLTARGKVLGVMIAMTQGEVIFTPDERELLTTIGYAISTGIDNAQLLEEASRASALEELDLLRTELLASVSHELRTPLTAIKGLASTLVQTDVQWDEETQQDFLRTIDQESDKLTHIVGDLLDMSQLEAGIMKMDKTQSKISVIVNQLRNQFNTLVTNHRFEIEVPSKMPMIYVDEVRMGEVIINLISNAAAYSEEGTLIILQARRRENEIEVSVIDEGIGILPEHLDNIFDRFFRLESGVARRRGGTGLGLAICKGVIEAHDGQIWVESKVGVGSKFIFSLPIIAGT